MSADRWVAGPKEKRAAELTAMLTDPSIRAIVPPWGGAGTALDLLDQLDYAAIAAADPTWVVGYSDSSTWMVPPTLRAGRYYRHLGIGPRSFRHGRNVAYWKTDLILWLAEEAAQPSGRSDGAHALARPQVGRSRKVDRRSRDAG